MRIPIKPKERQKIEKELVKVKKHLSEIEGLMKPPVTKAQLAELRKLRANALSLIAEYEDWLANGMVLLPPNMLMGLKGK